MSKHISATWQILLPLDPGKEEALYLQLYQALRQAILTGQIHVGTRLPPTRVLAQELQISRTTVVTAFDQLLAEGYLETRIGSGTFVASTLPEEMLHAPPTLTTTQPLPRQPRLSRRSQQLANSPLVPRQQASSSRAFQVGLPALDAFPFELWSRLAARHYQKANSALLGYGDPAGYLPLREAIAQYLTASRAVRCRPEQVIVVAGAQQAIEITARTLLEEEDCAWLEDPGYNRAHAAFLGAGVRVFPIPLDQEGLSVEAGKQLAERAQMAYVTPSHQYPLGMTMSLSRRLELLEWAQSVDAWILEDDYDSEFRYRGRPLASLQGLDTSGQVIYMGTFSKVLFPALRLGYLVLPLELVEPFVAMRALSGRHSPTLEQATLADFILEGHFVRHIRQMRSLYATRQRILREAIRHELGDLLELEEHDAGMHLPGWLPEDMDDERVSRAAALLGVDVQPLSAYTRTKKLRPGLLLGYAGVNEEEIWQGARSLRQAIQHVRNLGRASAAPAFAERVGVDDLDAGESAADRARSLLPSGGSRIRAEGFAAFAVHNEPDSNS